MRKLPVEDQRTVREVEIDKFAKDLSVRLIELFSEVKTDPAFLLTAVAEPTSKEEPYDIRLRVSFRRLTESRVYMRTMLLNVGGSRRAL